MRFVDLHIHALFGVDDGPDTEREMYHMLDVAYEDGTRIMCLTPHYHPGYFGENRAKVDYSFRMLQKFAEKKYPKMKLLLGNELRYSKECVSWLCDSGCRTLNGTDYILVDFLRDESERTITKAMEHLMSAGYTPVLAHVERYRDLSVKRISELSQNGVWMQLDVNSIFGAYGMSAKHRSKVLLKESLIDLVSSDSHGITSQTPKLSHGYQFVVRKHGRDYANTIFYDNGRRLLLGDDREGLYL